MVNTEPDNYWNSYRALFGVITMSSLDYLSRLFNQYENNVMITPTIIGATIDTNMMLNMVSPPSMLKQHRSKRRLLYYTICEFLSICTSDKLNYVIQILNGCIYLD